MAITTVFGVPHYYQLTTEGAGPPLVFIHGWLLSHKYWQPMVDQLRPHHPCLTYDLRGFGESRYHLDRYQPEMPVAAAQGASASPYGLGAYAQDLAMLLQQLDLGPVWVVGHSLGGSIALWLAHCFPALVRGVVCLNSGGGIYLEREFQQFRQVGQSIVQWRRAWLGRLPLLPLLLTRMMVHQPLAYRWGRDRCLDLLQADPAAALGTLLESTTETEVHLLPRVVASLQQPVYFIAGRQDQVMHLRYVNHLAGYLKAPSQGQSRVIPVENCGHLAMVEQPRVVAQVLAEILSAPHGYGSNA